jgi:hypothetical protein
MASREVHRLADLDRRGLAVALVLAGLVLLAPLQALWRVQPTWVPSGDNALIELRARDVGTSRTPLIGQPSTSSNYGVSEQNVSHPGPLQFYLLAVPVRLFGGPMGMLVTTVALISACALVVLWVFFRQLGITGGFAAAIALAAVMFTTGAASLVNPVSSNMAGYPLLATAALCWALFCGDSRLLPLTAAVASFTAQQHLSVVGVTAVLVVAGLGGLLVGAWRSGELRDRAARRRWTFLGITTLALSVVLWLPVIIQELTGDPGNLSAIADFGTDGTRSGLGVGSALTQLTHAAGLLPLLGRTELSGYDLLSPLSVGTIVSALVGAVLLIGLAWWRRREDPRWSRLVVMAGVLAVGGLVSGASVPEGPERLRLVFYHWALALDVLLLVAWLVLIRRVVPLVASRWRGTRGAAAHRAPSRLPAPRPLAAAVVAILVLVPVVVNPFLDRSSSGLTAAYSKVPRQTIDSLVAQIKAHRAELPGPTLLLTRGGQYIDGVGEALGARLADEGVPVVFPKWSKGYVADDRVVDPKTVRSALVLVITPNGPPPVPGKRIAAASPVPGFDRGEYRKLVQQAQSVEDDQVVLGPKLEVRLDQLPTMQRALTRAALQKLPEYAPDLFRQRGPLALLADAPPVSPKLDHDLLVDLRDHFPDAQRDGISAFSTDVYVLDRPELLDFTLQNEL